MAGWLPISAFVACLYGFAMMNALSAAWGADRWLDAGDRLPNLRILKTECRGAFAQRFLVLKDIGRDTLLLFGDSQVFASSVDDDKVWGHLVAKEMRLREVSLAVLDGRPADTEYLAELVARTGKRAAVAISNLNLSHFEPKWIGFRHIPPAPTGPLTYAGCAFSARRLFIETRPPIPSDGDTHSRFVGGALPTTYFDADLDAIRPGVAPMLNAVAKTARRSVSFVAPARLASFDEYHFDRPRYENGVGELVAACGAGLTHLCIEDTSSQLAPDAFFDIVHLTENGHSAFAQVLLQALGTGPTTPLHPPPTISITFDHYGSTYDIAFPIMKKFGLAGTFYVDPRAIDRDVEGVTSEQLRELQRAGWEIGAYSGFNMMEFLVREGPQATRKKMFELSEMMSVKGFPAKGFAPASRAWSDELRSLSEGIFMTVRVARSMNRIGYPIEDPLYVDGGRMDSLSARDTDESLLRRLEGLVAEGGLQPVVVHKVGDDADPVLSISAANFESFCARIAKLRDQGSLRVVPFTPAVTGDPPSPHSDWNSPEKRP